MTERVKPSKC